MRRKMGKLKQKNERTCWKSHLARDPLAPKTSAGECWEVSQQNSYQRQWQRFHIVVTCHATLEKMTPLCGKRPEKQRDEREIRVLRHVAQNEMGEKWWMTKLYSKCASSWHVTTNEDQLESSWENGDPYRMTILALFCFEPLESQILALNFRCTGKHPFCIGFRKHILCNHGVYIARVMKTLLSIL